MNYIQQAYKGLHVWWLYLIGSMIVFLCWQIIGNLPLIAVLIIKSPSILEVPKEISDMVALVGKNLFLALALFGFLVGLIGLFITVKFIHKLSILNLTTARSKIDWKRFWFIFALWGFFSIGSTLIGYYANPENYIIQFNLMPFLVLSVITIILIPIQTSFEEYFFRGYLMQGFGLIFKNKWSALLITSVGFGLVHGFNPEVTVLGPIIIIFYIGTGLFLGVMTLMDEGLELALGFHAANNIFIALLVTSDWSALQTHAILKNITDPSKMLFSEIFIPVFVIYPILLFILAKKYKWMNWKYKLLGRIDEPAKDKHKIIE